MRQILIIAAAAIITAIVASGATVIVAQSAKNNTDTVSNAVDMMQLMKDARNRADERADPVD
jgi:type II secretory pathway pseudopilin PulG